MLSTKPYFIRAIYDWIVDSECTPYIVISAEAFKSDAWLLEFEKEGKVVFNISPEAVTDLEIENSQIFFSATFSGIAHEVFINMDYVLGIYAIENGEGLFFDSAEQQDFSELEDRIPADQRDTSASKNKKKHLKIVE